MRQELQLQKLRARQERQSAATQSKSTESCPSLLPALEEATHIVVEDSITVSAFGRPLPDLPSTFFCLPWL